MIMITVLSLSDIEKRYPRLYAQMILNEFAQFLAEGNTDKSLNEWFEEVGNNFYFEHEDTVYLLSCTYDNRSAFIWDEVDGKFKVTDYSNVAVVFDDKN